MRSGDQRIKNGLGLQVSQYASRARIAVRFPSLPFLNYLAICSRLSVTTAGDSVSVCNGKQVKNLALFDGVPDAGGASPLGIRSQVWVQSPADAAREFGSFPAAHVEALAFGSIPVTATVHVSQVVRQGLVQPLQLSWVFFPFVAAGTPVKGWGVAPHEPSGITQLNLPARTSGQVDVSLSDVTIDGEPVDVGGSCAARSASITLDAPGGYLDQAAKPTRGQASSFNPFTAPSYLDGNVDIGAFTRCTDGRENLDPLLSSFISGPHNPVDAQVVDTLTGWCSGVGDVDCAAHDDVASAGHVAAHVSTVPPRSVLDGLSPTQRAVLRRLMHPQNRASPIGIDPRDRAGP